MNKYLTISLVGLFSACTALKNPNKGSTLQTIEQVTFEVATDYIALQKSAINYLKRPLCTDKIIYNCRYDGVSREIAELDKKVVGLINTYSEDLPANEKLNQYQLFAKYVGEFAAKMLRNK